MPDHSCAHHTHRQGSVLLLTALVLSAGCTALFPGRSEEAEKEARLRELITVPDPPDLIREAAAAHGMRPIQVDGVAMVRRLGEKGGPADPSPYRDQLIEEMKRDDIDSPNHLLERSDTALVRVRGVVPPGAQRRDRLDLRVLSPPGSRVSDLHGGQLEKSRLRHQQRINRAIRQSDVMVIGQGQLLTRADYEPGDDVALNIEGTVLAGGTVQTDRKLGLILRPEFEHAKLAADLAAAINRRFFFFDGTTRRGIAKALEDDYIEIELHPRYRKNVYRLMAVVRAMWVKAGSAESQQRLESLAKQLANPATAADAALQLEAIGESAIPTLLEGIESTNPELRFYAAEALAYLDRSEAVAPLEQAAQNVAAFRHDALLALQELQRHESVEALKRLMDEPSLETRYGAFCALRRREDAHSHLIGRNLGAMDLFKVASTAPPAVVISLRENPEIVIFGTPPEVDIPRFLRSSGLMLMRDAADASQLKVSRFARGEDDRRSTAGKSVESIVKAIAAVGGGYGDVVAMLRIAKDKGYLSGQLAIDPLPRPLRTYHRDSEESEEE